MQGVFECTNGLVRSIDSGELDRALLNYLNQQIELVKKAKITPQEAISNVKKRSPALSQQFQFWMTWGVSFAALMIAAATALMDYKDAGGNERLEERVDALVDQALEDHMTKVQPTTRFVAPAPLKFSLGSQEVSNTHQQGSSGQTEKKEHKHRRARTPKRDDDTIE
ncbi:hypothetical protein [Salipiger thiooxidans]|uniref:hypothetical protein n=1 Tax=Salipiger thiooxidans TaxID=282683 RepID=UPI001A8FCBA3|nr:hypothetical protein [Salipiger thiooxidans]